MKKSFRLLLINILDSEHGVHENTFNSLQEFSLDNFGNDNFDIFSVVDGAEDHCWLEEEQAEEFRKQLNP